MKDDEAEKVGLDGGWSSRDGLSSSLTEPCGHEYDRLCFLEQMLLLPRIS